MIQILTVRDKEQQQQLCQKAGITYTNDLHIIAVFEEDDRLQQGAIFRYHGTDGEIMWLDMGDDLDLTDGLARSVLSIMEMRGVEMVTLPLVYKSLAEKLRFSLQNDHYEVSLKGFFCCSCQHK